jgi:nitrite reductase/ring-hydroxylating ferredoxin subunit
VPFYPVAELSALVKGSNKRVVVKGVPICIVYVGDGQVYALADTCTHEGESLSKGTLVGLEIECPAHNSRFDVRTGAVCNLPASEAVHAYDVVIEEGYVCVAVDDVQSHG